ncbi:hypothetical protein [Winogradskyella sediminis]|uniref:hypothetical protein n=1 Tax=Winogradskyella sediminis TaxID=1382466 RepID=UPI003AA81449
MKLKDISNDLYETYQTYYRIAFYAVDSLGFPAKLIYHENILIKPERQTKKLKIDLKDKMIPFCSRNGIFVGIETVRLEKVKITNTLHVTTPSVLHTHSKK